MTVSERPPVESGIPPRAVLRLVNPIVRALLRSPLHRVVSKRLMLLTVKGRKSGRSYSIPVGRHQSDRMLVVSAAGGWRFNLRGGAAVRVTLDGRECEGHAELEEDPDNVARAYKALLDELGAGEARQLGLKLNVDRLPTAEEIKPVVAQRAIARIRLTDDSTTSAAR
jgi:hypothetical protein